MHPICSSFSSTFRCKVRLYIWDFSCFLRKACIAIYFPLRTVFSLSQRFWAVVFSFVSTYFFLTYLVPWFNSMLFNLHVFVVFPDFFLWLTSSFIVLWSESKHGMTSIFLYLWRADLWPRMRSTLENVPRALENNVCSAALGWNVLNMSVMSSGPACHLKSLFPCWSSA